MKKTSQFQPAHNGAHTQVSVNPGMTVSHSADRTHIGEHTRTNGYTGGKDPKPKHGGGVTPVHGGMVHVTDGKPVTGGGSSRAYLDSMSGATVQPGKGTMSAPGWSNGTVRSGNPMVHAPASKVLTPPAVHPSMKDQTTDNLQELGRAVLAQAVTCARGKEFNR